MGLRFYYKHMGIKASQIKQVTTETPSSTIRFTWLNNDYYKRACQLSCLAIIVLVFFVISLNSCTNTASKLQGKWKVTDIMYDDDNIESYYTDEDVVVEFIGDSLQIFTDLHSLDKDTIRIKILGNIWMRYNYYIDSYDTIATIESLSKEKIVLNVIDKLYDYGVITRTYEKIIPQSDFSKEKEISQKKYEKNIVGEWTFTDRYSYGEWTKYGGPVGWHFIFEKDGSGYQLRDNRVVAFKWLMPANGNRIIITGSKYDEVFMISRMTKNTLLIVCDNEKYKLVRQ